MIAPIFSMLTAFHTLRSPFGLFFWFYNYSSKTNFNFISNPFFWKYFFRFIISFAWNTLSPYQQNRILTFLNPEKDPLGVAYQIIQSKTAIGSGGLFGKGLGQGTQTHLKFLPVKNQIYFVCFRGRIRIRCYCYCIFVIGFFIMQIIKFAFLSKDRFSSLALIGFATIFLSHVFINTAMTVGLIPVKGLPFPFVSAGGSFF